MMGAVMLPGLGAAESVEALLKKGNDLPRQGRDREALVEFQRAARTSRLTVHEVSLDPHLKRATSAERGRYRSTGRR